MRLQPGELDRMGQGETERGEYIRGVSGVGMESRYASVKMGVGIRISISIRGM